MSVPACSMMMTMMMKLLACCPRSSLPSLSTPPPARAHALGKEYDDSGVTDALAKHTNFEQAEPFNSNDVDAFAARRNRANGNDSVDVSAKVRNAARSKKLQQLRSKIAQLSKNDKQAFLAEFTGNADTDEEPVTPKKKKKKLVVLPEAVFSWKSTLSTVLAMSSAPSSYLSHIARRARGGV